MARKKKTGDLEDGQGPSAMADEIRPLNGGEQVDACEPVVAHLSPGSTTVHLDSSKLSAIKRQSILLKRGDTDLSLDRTGLQRYLPECMRYAFADHEAEQLYREYYENEKRSDFQILVNILLITSSFLFSLFVYEVSFNVSLIGQTIALGLSILATLGTAVIVRSTLEGVSKSPPAPPPPPSSSSPSATPSPRSPSPRAVWTVLPFLMWTIEVAHIVCDLWLFPARPRNPVDSVGWVLMYTYCIYVIYPLRLRFCFLLSLTMASIHMLIVGSNREDDISAREHFAEQLGANSILFAAVNILGIMSFFFCERQQRRAFLETCQSLEAKLVIEEESQEQERLLLSVLPKHVAEEIKQDLGGIATGQFKKIYMSRHENVSILFADIVGFTAFSSTCPAPELVRTLNELFARFDKLAEKYHQLRIKILGDCYYCISGAPEERPDHAVLCVHMGLSMVEAIRSVREATKTNVDMRVGVHTGGVLAGVMGQRQWQFDVYSKDVELANKMESGGLPGMVHISEKTFSFLKGEFEVKDGDGASREEAIRMAGCRTYLIVSVIKPWPEGTLDAEKPDDQLAPCVNGATARGSKGSKEPEEEEPSIIGPGGEIINYAEYNRRLRHELLNRDCAKSMRKHARPITSRFRDASYEHSYANTRDVTSSVSLLGLPVTLMSCLFAYLLIGPNQLVTWLVLLLSNCVLLATGLICTGPTICNSIPKPLASISRAVQERSWLRVVISASMMAIWMAAHVIVTALCTEDSASAYSIEGLSRNISSKGSPMTSLNGEDSVSKKAFHVHIVDGYCQLPHYLDYFAIIGMVSITTLTRISYLIKVLVIVVLTIVQVSLNFTSLRTSFKWYDIRMYGNEYNIRHDVLVSLILVTVAFVMFIINRQFELVSRRLFLWQKVVEEQRELVVGMRKKNETLVYNILPPHVAILFLGRRLRDEELYSKSYDSVGVLFAAMPNFSDFYTEESVNNQGLECLRFLNEVISDYDALLEQSRFKDIIKIKTVGATYMAASGLNNDEGRPHHRPSSAGSSVTAAGAAAGSFMEKSHLEQLIEFALALKETLNNINKESFNNFVLRIGINEGPITAGVIGARKPHYDIWGNTVNVASRMESTGKAGSIQVVQETKDLLEQFGYNFEQRGLVSVKGKGMLRTFYLVGKSSN
ncbi:Adenylate cyclase type 3 [Halotydeus destructor]|nr:Adenylate cyclase type 3 [Halotydeus destructor]